MRRAKQQHEALLTIFPKLTKSPPLREPKGMALPPTSVPTTSSCRLPRCSSLQPGRMRSRRLPIMMCLLCLLGLEPVEAAAHHLQQDRAWQMPCRNAGSRPEQVVQPDEVVASAANGFVVDYANFTVMGRKVLDLLATMQQPQRPHCNGGSPFGWAAPQRC